jgi:C-terminal processing protease CtpA/Prc
LPVFRETVARQSCHFARMHCQSLVSVAVMVGIGCGAPSPRRAPSATPPPTAAIPTVEAVPDREDFETATVGSVPPGWTIAAGAKDIMFTAARDGAGTVLRIVSAAGGTGSITRAIDVAQYRGKRIEITARGSCKPESRRGRVLVGVNVARPGPRGYGDRVRTERIEAADWRDYRAIADVARDATGLDLVVFGNGPSIGQVDDIRLRVLGDAGAGDEPARVLEGRGLDNVVAFTRLYGIVRYFHPSDEAAALDGAAWERFVIRGVHAVEGAADAGALKSRLEELFAPIAPTVGIRREGETAPAVAAAERPVVHWNHHGLGISKDGPYRSNRGDDLPALTTIAIQIEPAQVRGKEIKVTLRGHGKLVGDGADAGLWIAEKKADGSQGFYTEPEEQPPVGATWTTISVLGRISDDAAALKLGVQVTSTAEVWLEPPVMTVDGKPVAIPGWGTSGADLASEWTSSGMGSSVEVGGKGCDQLRTCLHVSQKPMPIDHRPWTGALGGGVAAWVPLELSMKDGKTVPAATASLPSWDARPLLVTDRATRLAAVIIAWNIFEHFYPYFDVTGTDWMPELPRRLAEAALDDGPDALHVTLRRLAHDLHDGHGGVIHPSEDRSWSTPFLWERVEGKLTITQVSEQCSCDLRAGDVVTAIEREPTEQAIAAAGALTSAATEQYMTDQVLSMLRTGAEGSRRKLTVKRDGVTRDVAVALVAPASEIVEKRPASGDEIAPGIRYVNLDKANQEQWTKILPDLAAAKAVVCDMRGYPNFTLIVPLAHFTKSVLKSARWNVPNVARPDREETTFYPASWRVQPLEPYVHNVVFLTDGRAVSAAETFMGIVEAHKLGPIVGSPTAGTNGNVNPFTLPGGYIMWWTGMKVLKHDGSRHHGIGIRPTVPATRTLAGVAAGRDEVLEKGIEVARQLISAGAKNRNDRK